MSFHHMSHGLLTTQTLRLATDFATNDHISRRSTHIRLTSPWSIITIEMIGSILQFLEGQDSHGKIFVDMFYSPLELSIQLKYYLK